MLREAVNRRVVNMVIEDGEVFQLPDFLEIPRGFIDSADFASVEAGEITFSFRNGTAIFTVEEWDSVSECYGAALKSWIFKE